MYFKSFFLSLLALSIALSPALAADDTKGGDQPNIAPIRTWRVPMMAPRFALLCVHGLGLNSESYKTFAQQMIRNGAIVYAIDVRGFGLWMQAEGHTQVNFDDCLKDIKTALQSIHQANPGIPVFLLGESMGGAIALRATSMYPELIDGLISCVPAEERFKTKRTDIKVALEMIKGGPNHEFDIGKQVVDQAATAKTYQDGKTVKVVNQTLAQDWEKDPLCRMTLSPKELMQFQSFMNDNHDAVKKITSTPVLFVQGLNDQLVKPEGTWELCEEIRTPDRIMVALPTRHLVFEEQDVTNEVHSKAANNLVLAWLNAHVKAINAGGSTASDAPAATPAQPQLTGGKPTIVAFYNGSIEQQGAKIADILNTCQQQFGNRVQLISLNINDTTAQPLVNTFNVGAVPTMIFLKPDGSITSQLVGDQNKGVVVTRVIELMGPPPNMPPRMLQQMQQMRGQGGDFPRRRPGRRFASPQS